MKKLITVVMVITSLVIVGDGFAKDVHAEFEITKILSKTKNDEKYHIIIVKVPKVLNGIKYDSYMMITSFSATYEQSAQLIAGEKLEAIVSIRKYQGEDSGILRAVIN